MRRLCHVTRHVGAESSSTSSTRTHIAISSATSSNSDRIFSWQNKNIPLTVREYSLDCDKIFFIRDRIFLSWVNSVRLVFLATQWFFSPFLAESSLFLAFSTIPDATVESVLWNSTLKLLFWLFWAQKCVFFNKFGIPFVIQRRPNGWYSRRKISGEC